jgi:hypothetical protein
MNNSALPTTNYWLFFRVLILFLSILSFIAGRGLWALHDYGLPIWPLLRECLFVGSFVGLLLPPFLKFIISSIPRRPA